MLAHTLTPAQLRAARGLVGWSRPQLAMQSGVSLSTVKDFEDGRRTPYATSLAVMITALEAAGVVFVEANGGGPGVRLRTP